MVFVDLHLKLVQESVHYGEINGIRSTNTNNLINYFFQHLINYIIKEGFITVETYLQGHSRRAVQLPYIEYAIKDPYGVTIHHHCYRLGRVCHY